MGEIDVDGPFRLHGADGLAAVRATFARIGYTDEHIACRDGSRAPAALPRLGHRRRAF